MPSGEGQREGEGPRGRQRGGAGRQALDEDLYADAVADIIRRDFFPDLDALRFKNAYLDAAAAGDVAKLRDATFGLAQLTAQGARTPLAPEMLRGMAAPSPHSNPEPPDDDASLAGAEVIDTDLRLDGFLGRYTSEDNASFGAVLDRQNEKRREKYSWAFDPEKKTLLLQDDGDRPKLITGPPRPQDANAGALVLASAATEDPKAREYWSYKAKNELFYYPPGIEGQSLLSDRGPEKEISLANTRFPKNVETLEAEALEREKTQEVWRAMAAATPGLFAGGATPSSGATPSINGHSFVPSTPTLAPGVDVDPIMTWGMVESTPLLISGAGDDPEKGPSFKLPPTPRRDVLAHEMGRSAAKSLRQRAAAHSPANVIRKTTPAGTTPSDRARLLSPAARQFLQKNRLATPLQSPLQTPLRSPAVRTPSAARQHTPQIRRPGDRDRPAAPPVKAAGEAEHSDITENLLDLGGSR